MTITEVSGCSTEEILDVIDDGVRVLQDAGVEPRFVVVGPAAYDALRSAIASRFGRGEGSFESYQWLSIVVDPFRGEEVCVLPGASAMTEPVRVERR